MVYCASTVASDENHILIIVPGTWYFQLEHGSVTLSSSVSLKLASGYTLAETELVC